MLLSVAAHSQKFFGEKQRALLVELVPKNTNAAMLALTEVPQHGNTVLATRSARRSIWGDGNRVKYAVMANKIRAQFAVAQVQ